MSRKAWAYIWGLLASSALVLGWAAVNEEWNWANFDWVTPVVLTGLATVAQLFEAEHGKQSYYPHFVFFFAAVILLDPFWLIIVITVPHLIEWAKARLTKAPHLRDWYIQPFNIAGHVIPGVAANWAYVFANGRLTDLLHSQRVVQTADLTSLAPLLAAAGAILVYIGLNHIIIGQVLLLARGITWQKSGILGRESMLPDIIMSFLGFVVAVLWNLNPWYAFPALLPLVLMYQALQVPQLKQDAQTDGKTGLWNARHFATLYKAEMERAKRFDRPLSVIMADLDLLRNINNTYGHIAGDQVLTGIGRIIREAVREYDIAGRFGGEEFAIALPETTCAEACIIAERLRIAVEEATFQVATSATPIQVTMSLGVAAFPVDADDSNELIHEADIAVYQAKLNGRNCVVSTAEVPHYVKLSMGPAGDRLTSPLVAPFSPRPIDASGQVVGAAQGGSEPHAASSAEPPSAREASAPVAPHGLIPHMQREEAAQPAGSEPDSQHVAVSETPEPRTGRHGLKAGEPAEAPNIAGQALPREIRSGDRRLPLLVGVVVALGIITTIAGILLENDAQLGMIALFTGMAIAAELLQVGVYGENTLSVSVAVIFCAAALTGVLGAAAVSAGIALAHYWLMRPALYKTAFNWATHLLAALPPAMALALVDNSNFDIKQNTSSILVLILPSLVGTAAYFFVESGLMAAAIGLARGANIRTTWQQQFAWLSSHYVVLCLMGVFLAIAYVSLDWAGIVVFSMPVLMMRLAQKQYVDRTEDSMHELKRMNQQLSLANQEVVSASKAMRELNEELFRTLARIIDARDPFVCNHASKVADYAVAIGLELGLQAERLEPLRQAGFLHDIGKIGLSEHVLHKPGKLTAEEYEYVKTHAALGGEFLMLSRGLRHLAPLVRHHHERWDGTGYPDRLAGEEISLESRILAVCDAIEAMASDRPYRLGLPLEEIIAEVKRCSGTQFDPGVAGAFVSVIERERGSMLTNSSVDLGRKYAEGALFFLPEEADTRVPFVPYAAAAATAQPSQNGHKNGATGDLDTALLSTKPKLGKARSASTS